MSSLKFLQACLCLLLAAGAAQGAPVGPPPDAVARKHAAAGIACKECHPGTIPAKGAFKGKVPQVATNAVCLKCHESYKALAAKTANLPMKPYNPHVSHYGELDCYVCHRTHQASEFFCTSCHLDLKTPANWKKAPIPADV